MYTELDLEAYKLYVDYMTSEFCLSYHNIYTFVQNKEGYFYYYNDAKIKIRKSKLRKISEICTQE